MNQSVMSDKPEEVQPSLEPTRRAPIPVSVAICLVILFALVTRSQAAESPLVSKERASPVVQLAQARSDDQPRSDSVAVNQNPDSNEGREVSLWRMKKAAFPGLLLRLERNGENVIGTIVQIPKTASKQLVKLLGAKPDRVFLVGRQTGDKIIGRTRFGLGFAGRTLDDPPCKSTWERAETDHSLWAPFELKFEGACRLTGKYEYSLLIGRPDGSCLRTSVTPRPLSPPFVFEREAGPSEGIVFANGRYLEPPYRFDVDNGTREVRVNGERVVSRAGTAPTPLRRPPAKVTDIGVLVSAAQFYANELKLFGPEPPQISSINLLTDRLLKHHANAKVRLEDGRAIIEDGSGNEAGIILQQRRKATAAEITKNLMAISDGLQSIVSNGGGLFVVPNIITTVPSGKMRMLANDLLGAAKSPAEAKSTTVAKRLGSKKLARAVLKARAPQGKAGARIRHIAKGEGRCPKPAVAPEPEPATPTPSGHDAGRPCLHPSHADDHHRQSRTPNTAHAYLFTSATFEQDFFCSDPTVRRAANLHGYTVSQFDGRVVESEQVNESEQVKFHSEGTFENLILEASGHAGVLLICSHGNLDFEAFETKEEAEARAEYYRTTEFPVPGQTERRAIPSAKISISEGGTWWVGVGKDAIRRFWRDQNTIFVYEACNSRHIMTHFGAREAIGYEVLCPGGTETLWNDFWGRLDGTLDNGTKRNVGDAFEATAPGDISNDPDIRRRKGEGEWTVKGHLSLLSRDQGRTVLSPGVTECAPEDRIPVGQTVQGRVKFDAAMARTFTRNMLQLNGCGAGPLASNPRFTDDYTLEFDFTARQSGELTITVRQENTVAWPDTSGVYLDGNQDPQRSNHVGPNRDDFVWKVQCGG